jgi:tagatose 1,6-diphosphate aldolase
MAQSAASLPVPPKTLSAGEVSLRFVGIVPGEPARGLVPSYKFLVVAADGSEVGHINFRVGDTEHVRVCAGHIGFGIQKTFRGHGYALQACRAIAPFVFSVYDAVIITCDPDNEASRRTIERLGASFIDEVAVPAHDPHYQSGSRRKRRYQWKAEHPSSC